MNDHADEFDLPIADSTPMPAYAGEADDEAAELAAADAEIDAEDETDLEDDAGADDLEDDEDAAVDALDAEPAADEAQHAPSIELTPQVYARIHSCLSTQLAAIEAQIARAEKVAERDPFFDRWKVVLLAQRDRLRKQIGEVQAKAPAEIAAAAESVGATDEPLGATDEDAIEAEPQSLSA